MSRADHPTLSSAEIHNAASSLPLLSNPTQNAPFSPEASPGPNWDEKGAAKPARRGLSDARAQRRNREWRPAQLQFWFWVPLVTLQILLAVGLEIALRFSQKNQGWAVTADSAQSDRQHYAYTLPPVIIAMGMVHIWTKTDDAIKKLQPYLDLAQGNAPASRSILVDYISKSTFSVWIRALVNRHYIVSIAGLLSILALSFEPLAAALFVVRDTTTVASQVRVANLAKLGVNQDIKFQDLTLFVTAAGFSGASAQYTLPDPPFIFNGWTVAPFSIPTGLEGNGTVYTRTTAIKSEANCVKAATVTSTALTGDTGYTNTATIPGCTSTWSVDRNATHLFDAFLPTCDDDSRRPEWNRRVVFWFHTYEPTVMASATFCMPSISAWDVDVTIDLASSNITSVTPLQQVDNATNTVTGSPLNGLAYNGLSFDAALTRVNRFTRARQDATRLQLPAAVLQVAESLDVYSIDLFAQLTDRVYSTYLKVFAKSAYFLPSTEPMNVQVTIISKRLWLSAPSVHWLAVALLILSLVSTMVHLTHRKVRDNLHLSLEPGTIAAAVAIGGETDLARVLTGQRGMGDIEDMLSERRFRYDSARMKIFMDREGL